MLTGQPPVRASVHPGASWLTPNGIRSYTCGTGGGRTCSHHEKADEDSCHPGAYPWLHSLLVSMPGVVNRLQGSERTVSRLMFWMPAGVRGICCASVLRHARNALFQVIPSTQTGLFFTARFRSGEMRTATAPGAPGAAELEASQRAVASGAGAAIRGGWLRPAVPKDPAPDDMHEYDFVPCRSLLGAT